MTYKILTNDTFKILHRSNFRSAGDPFSANLKSDPLTVPNSVKSLQHKHLTFTPLLSEGEDNTFPNLDPRSKHILLTNPSDLVGISFLRTEEDV